MAQTMHNVWWIRLDEMDSTNSYLRRLDTPPGRRMTLVTAEYQCAGRGAGTNRWESARGENLLFSLRVVPSALPVRRMFALSEAAALAVRESLCLSRPTGPFPCPSLVGKGEVTAERLYTPLPTREGHGEGQDGEAFTVKWPNDIYYGDGKVAGILIENDLQGSLVRSSVIGIGINVNQRHFVSDAPNPVSLAGIVGHDVERSAVLERFMERMTSYFEQAETGGEEALDALHRSYIRHLYRFGQEHAYSDKDGTFRATIIDVDAAGHLILRDEEGHRRSYAFKELKFII